MTLKLHIFFYQVSPQTKMEPKYVVRDVEESLCETVAKIVPPHGKLALRNS